MRVFSEKKILFYNRNIKIKTDYIDFIYPLTFKNRDELFLAKKEHKLFI